MAKSESSPIRNHTKNSLTTREAGIALLLLRKFSTSPKPAGFERDGKAVRLVRENVEAFLNAITAEQAAAAAPPADAAEESSDAPEVADEAADTPEAEVADDSESDQDDDNSVPEIDGEDIG
jgi:hypothetical protein